MEAPQTLPAKSPLTSPNAFKSHTRRGSCKFDLKKNYSPKQQQLHGSKIFQRRVLDKHKPLQPIKMKFDVDPLNLFPLANRKPGTDSPELASTPINMAIEKELYVEPLNSSDPLNLLDEEQLTSGGKIGRKRRKKRPRTTSCCIDESVESTNDSSSLNIGSILVSPVESRCGFDKLYKPIIQQVVSPAKVTSPKQYLPVRKSSIKRDRSTSITGITYPNFNIKRKNKKVQHGSFIRDDKDVVYNDCCGKTISLDKRIQHLKVEMFRGKKCLDVGCNDGYVTRWVATNFCPKSIVGIDIDSGLMELAKNRLRLAIDNSRAEFTGFPLSCQSTLGPLSVDTRKQNISFYQQNYVPLSDEELQHIKPEYDVIMLLSVSKWMHLNYGDAGLQRTFKKIFLQLLPGGKLIFEPQTYNCYKESKNLTLEIRKNFDSMKFLPNEFITHLLSTEVGFAQSLCLAHTRKRKTSNTRPLYLLTKGGESESQQTS